MEPAGFELEVERGETVFAAAQRAGAHWPTKCFGQAQCWKCALVVREGHEHLEPPEPEESIILRQLTARGRRYPPRDTRLACQLRVHGDIVVDKPGATREA